MVKTPNCQEAEQKRSKGVELRATEKQLQLELRAGLETQDLLISSPVP